MIKKILILIILLFPLIGHALSIPPPTPPYQLVLYIPFISIMLSFVIFFLSFVIFFFIEREKKVKFKRKAKFLGSFLAAIFSGLMIYSALTLINFLINLIIIRLTIYFSYRFEFYYFLLVYLVGVFLYYVLIMFLISHMTNVKNISAKIWRDFFYRILIFFPITILIMFFVILMPWYALGVSSPGYYPEDYNKVIIIKEIIKSLSGFLLLFLGSLFIRRLLLSEKLLKIDTKK